MRDDLVTFTTNKSGIILEVGLSSSAAPMSNNNILQPSINEKPPAPCITTARAITLLSTWQGGLSVQVQGVPGKRGDEQHHPRTTVCIRSYSSCSIDEPRNGDVSVKAGRFPDRGRESPSAQESEGHLSLGLRRRFRACCKSSIHPYLLFRFPARSQHATSFTSCMAL